MGNATVPEISRFLGIVITMFYNDHPPFHIHARYGSDSATFGIEPVQLLLGPSADAGPKPSVGVARVA